jgi:hypothetical protein
MSTCKVADILNKEGVLTRSLYAVQILGLKGLNKVPATKWNGEKVWEIVTDYEYCGHSINWVSHIKEEQILLKDTHLAIVDEELYRKAQQVIEKRSTNRNRVNHIGKLLIDRQTGRNLLYNRKVGEEEKATYYSRVNNLRQYSINARAIEKVIYQDALNVIECCKFDQERFYNLFRQKLFKGKEFNQYKLKERLKKLNEEYSHLLEGYFSQIVCEDIYQKKSKQLLVSIKETEIELERCVNNKANIELFEIRFKRFLESIKNISKDMFDVIKQVVDKVYINEVKDKQTFDMTIIYKFECL